MLTLRPYQEAAISALWAYLREQDGNPVCVLPTGAGKSIVIAEVIRRAVEGYPGTRVLVLAHVAELLSQNAQELLGIWPEAPIGIYSASLGKRTLAPITFAGIQSVHSRAVEFQHVDLVLIDECHLLSPNGRSMYRKLLNELTQINPALRVIGLSATPYRLDSGHLCSGKDALFTEVAYEANVKKLIEDGYLSPLVTKRTDTHLDVSGVAVRGGEFVSGQLEAAVDVDAITQAAVDEIVAHGAERRAWLVFCAGVKHSFNVRDAIRSRGFSCETITGETPAGERKAILEDYRGGRIRCVTNANVLTTGVNIRPIDLLAFLRPTKSASLYVQMAGRAMRLSPETGKENGLVLDFAGLVAEHGPIDQVKVKGKRGQDAKGEIPSKECPECESKVFAAARECPCCGFLFPPPEPKLQATASSLAIISSAEPVWSDVMFTTHREHRKDGKPPSLLAEYLCGAVKHREWVCFSHDGFPRQKAEKWWMQRAGTRVPRDTAEALARVAEVRKPIAVQVRQVGKFTEVVGARFA